MDGVSEVLTPPVKSGGGSVISKHDKQNFDSGFTKSTEKMKKK